MSEFQSIPLERLRESGLNPRRHFDKKGLADLADSIKQHGVLTPILVRPSNGQFEIAAKWKDADTKARARAKKSQTSAKKKADKK